MAPSTPQVFNGVSLEQYAKLVEKTRAAGVDLSGNSGTATKYGVEVTWTYTPESQTLVLQCLHTPIFVKAADVDAKLNALVKESLAEA